VAVVDMGVVVVVEETGVHPMLESHVDNVEEEWVIVVVSVVVAVPYVDAEDETAEVVVVLVDELVTHPMADTQDCPSGH
jgi:hypothetical protein